MVPHDRAVLSHSVVVDEDRRRADVGAHADLGVADVRQVRHLGAGADHGVLGLDVRADLAAVAEAGAWPEVGKRADRSRRSDHRARGLAAYDRSTGSDRAAVEGCVGADRGAGGDRGAAAQVSTGQEGDVGGELDIDVDPGRLGIDDSDAGPHPPLDHPVAQRPPERGELDTVVDAFTLDGVVEQDRTHAEAVRPGQRHGVGEVGLALGVAGADPLERLGQELGVEGVDPGVDLTDRRLLVGGVTPLDDGDHRAGAVTNDAAVRTGLRRAAGQDGDGVAGLRAVSAVSSGTSPYVTTTVP